MVYGVALSVFLGQFLTEVTRSRQGKKESPNRNWCNPVVLIGIAGICNAVQLNCLAFLGLDPASLGT